jgi:DNA-binding NarL/FixJ family response regulator
MSEEQREFRFRALVVDDSPIALHTISSLLAQNPKVEVLAGASDGCQALELAAALRPDIVVMDVQMPRMNGLEAARHIASQYPSMHVILVTLHDTAELRDAALQCGARWFIPKERLTKELTPVIDQIEALSVRRAHG